MSWNARTPSDKCIEHQTNLDIARDNALRIAARLDHPALKSYAYAYIKARHNERLRKPEPPVNLTTMANWVRNDIEACFTAQGV